MNEGLVSYEAFSSFFSVTFFPYGNKKKRGSLFKIGSERLVRVCRIFKENLKPFSMRSRFFFAPLGYIVTLGWGMGFNLEYGWLFCARVLGSRFPMP